MAANSDTELHLGNIGGGGYGPLAEVAVGGVNSDKLGENVIEL